METNPLLVEVTRGSRVESVHRGSLVVVDDRGATVLALGDVATAVFPRSAVKAVQALPYVESGAVDAYGGGDAEIALACASHNGEAVHVTVARAMLAAAGLEPDALACGPQLPALQPDLESMVRGGQGATRLHNNCSGKHAGMLLAACHLGLPVEGYERPGHPLQLTIRRTMEELFGTTLTEDSCGIDGCSLPTWAAPLTGFAAAFARIGTGEGLSPERAAAFARIRRAAARRPEMVAGSGRFCTRVMRELGESCFVKTGAEGVFCAALPEARLGLALKIDDGATRASEVATAAVLAALLRPEAGSAAARLLGELAAPPIRNRVGRQVGELRPSAVLTDALARLAPRPA